VLGSESPVERYIAARDEFVGRIAKITRELDQWTDEHREKPPTLRSIATFEGLRGERSRLLSEFEEFEDRFVLELLQRLSAEDGQAPRQTQQG
jgi:hypothetical protein